MPWLMLLHTTTAVHRYQTLTTSAFILYNQVGRVIQLFSIVLHKAFVATFTIFHYFHYTRELQVLRVLEDTCFDCTQI